MSRAPLAAFASFGLLSLACAPDRPAATQGMAWGAPGVFRQPATETFAPPVAASAPLGSAFIFLPGAQLASQVRYRIIEGMAVYQGDILLGPAHLVQYLYGRPGFGAAPTGAFYATSTPHSTHRWPGAVIPYAIDASVTADKRAMIDWAVAHVSSESVVKLQPRGPSDTDHVVFTENGSGCSSYVGRIGGPQTIQVSGCGSRGSVVHEIGHAAGFFHEQGRADRDGFVTIVWSEISAGEEAQFEISNGTADIGAYDYGSIMHYSAHAFSRTGNATIIPRDPNASIGQRNGLSASDKAALAQLYGGLGVPSVPGVPTPAPAPAPAVAQGFGGTYTSNRGDVTCGESGQFVNCSFPGGSLACASGGGRLDCSWFGTGNGRAVFTRQDNGNLSGTYGDLFSADNRGAWDLVRTGGAAPAPATAPAPGFPAIPGLPALPGLPPLPAGFPTPTLPPGWPLPQP